MLVLFARWTGLRWCDPVLRLGFACTCCLLVCSPFGLLATSVVGGLDLLAFGLRL